MGQGWGKKGGVGAGKGDDVVPGALSNPRDKWKRRTSNRQVAKRTSMRHRHESGRRQGKHEGRGKGKREARGVMERDGSRGGPMGKNGKKEKLRMRTAPPSSRCLLHLLLFQIAH